MGHRLVGQLPPLSLVELWMKCTSRIVKYGFAVEYRDLEPPRTGIFDGLRIAIDPDVGFEMQCFVLLHLFGHSVQWVAPSLVGRLHVLQHTQEFERFMCVLKEYEFDAASFGMQLMHEVGLGDLDQWYSDFVETDWRYVERYYLDGLIPSWHDCIANRSAVVTPQPIPPLELHPVQIRFAF